MDDLSDLPPEVIRELSRAAQRRTEPAKPKACRPQSAARETVQREYPAGTKLDAIAAMCGVSRQRIEQIARSLGLPQRRVGSRHKPPVPKGTRRNASMVKRAAAALEAKRNV